MRRPIWWAFNGAAAVSTVLFVATCVLWARSYFFEYDYTITYNEVGPRPTEGPWRPLKRHLMVHMLDRFGVCEIGIVEMRLPPTRPPPLERQWSRREGWEVYNYSGPVTSEDRNRFFGWNPHLALLAFYGGYGTGFETNFSGYAGVPMSVRGGRVKSPYWAVLLLLCVLPALHAFRFMRRRCTAPGGLCSSCGYDLRATPDRCPECGAAPAAASNR